MDACLIPNRSFSAFRLIRTDCTIQSLIVVISDKFLVNRFFSAVGDVSINDGYILTALNLDSIFNHSS